MPHEIFPILIDIENGLADFYQRARSVSRTNVKREIFDIMSAESLEHARRIGALAENHVQPSFNRKQIYELREKIKVELWNNVSKAVDITDVVQAMCDAEERIGKLYHAISLYFVRQSEFYKILSVEIESLSSEEYGHCDSIKKQFIT